MSILFVASLVIGWFVAGRVLAPIGRITAVARDIQATDLSRRIALRGPRQHIADILAMTGISKVLEVIPDAS